jgi:diguanylate cyclase (GGDEF)-like protein
LFTIMPTYGRMKLEIFSHGDALRHTAKRVAIAVCSTIVLTLLLTAITFGTDPDTSVRLGSMATHGVLIGMIIAALLTGVLTYRSSVLMRELNGARSDLLRISRTDQLTGLPNRVVFNEQLDLSIKSARRNAGKCAVLFIDLDRFKIINDTWGHAAGDALLVEVAERLRGSVRESDVITRVGGDEFIIILNEVSHRDQAALIARQVLSAVRRGIFLGGHENQTTASVGIAMFPSDGSDVETLTKNADMAMYRAKEHGKNDFCFFEEKMDAAVAARNRLGQELCSALTAGQFEVHYQPIVSIETSRTVSMEALVRWRHPEHGLLSPDKFISLAEETGLIDRLGELVLRQACLDAVKWPPDVKVAVNISPVQFRNSCLATRVAGILAETRLPAKRLELEITESVLLQRSDENIRILHDLRDSGLSIALDDFGTGYSSLSYLRTFPFDKIKIDRSFVSEMSRMDVCAAIVCAVANLGRTLDIVTTAEGVETKEQLELLRAAGCTQAQGYLFGRPCPVAQLKFANGVDWTPSEREVALTARDIMLVRTSFSLIVPIQDTLASLFYDRLFVVAPELRPLFPDDLGGQKRKLMKLLTTCIGRLHDFSALAPSIQELGARHVGYGAKPKDYATIGETLLWALAHGLGVAFEPELRSAWGKVYQLLAKTMQAGAGVAENGTAVQAVAPNKPAMIDGITERSAVRAGVSRRKPLATSIMPTARALRRNEVVE